MFDEILEMIGRKKKQPGQQGGLMSQLGSLMEGEEGFEPESDSRDSRKRQHIDDDDSDYPRSQRRRDNDMMDFGG